MTEPKDTEASWLSEALLRFVVERAALALSLYDAQGRLLWCNQVARETLGDVGARVADPAGELVALGELPDDGPLVQERRFVRSDGTVMWGLLTLNWVQGRGDGDRHALATLTELNVHKRAELMQKALASNMRSSADAVVGLEPNGTITAWNPAAEQMFGFTTAQIMGKPVHVLTPSPGDAALRQGLEEVAAGKSVQLQTQALRADSQRIDVLIDASPVRDATAETAGALLVVRDISAQRVLSEQLATNMSRYQALLEAVPDAIFRFRADGTLLDYVPAARPDLETDSEPRIGENLRNMLPADLADKILSVCGSALNSGQTRSFEYAHGDASGPGLRYFEGRAVKSGDEEVVSSAAHDRKASG